MTRKLLRFLFFLTLAVIIDTIYSVLVMQGSEDPQVNAAFVIFGAVVIGVLFGWIGALGAEKRGA